MPSAPDYRARAFSAPAVRASAKSVSRTAYWQLYTIENLLRVLVHSVLSVQVGPNWFAAATDQRMQRQVARFRNQYTNSPWHSSPGAHDVYYTHLGDLGEIMRANSNLFLPVVPDVDQWIARIDQIRLPRNIVGHMNWPTAVDRQRFGLFMHDIEALISKLVRDGHTIVIPPV